MSGAPTEFLDPESGAIRARATVIRRLKHRLGSFLGQYPNLYLPAARLRHRWVTRGRKGEGSLAYLDVSPPPTERRTDVVIEGFPRSANSFAVAAFRLPQPTFVYIAHHHHVASQVLAGIRAGIPTIVLVRDPQDAILSLLIRHPEIGPRQALVDYIHFYGPLVGHVSRFVCARFEEVTTDFGAVIRRVNERYGTSFQEFEHSAANVKECFAQIESHHSKGGEDPEESRIPRPSAKRRTLKSTLLPILLDERLSQKRTEANALYERLIRDASHIAEGE